MAQTHIGFIGMGLMGVPMAGRLLEAGFDVSVWNRDLDKAQPLSEQGGRVCRDLKELMHHCDVVMICVTDTDAVEQVVFGDCYDGGIAAHGRSGQVLVDFSSIDPARTREMAQRLHDEAGMFWVDAPVSGGVVGAEEGTLAIMAGGREQDVRAVEPLLQPLCQRLTRMGDVGAGQVTKICNQMLVSCNVLVMAEVMAMADKAGVDARQIPAALKGGFADSTPLQLTGPRMAERDFEPVKWHVKTLLKDLDMANDLAKTMQSSIPMAGLGAELMRLHGSQGNLDRDPCTLVEMYTEKKD